MILELQSGEGLIVVLYRDPRRLTSNPRRRRLMAKVDQQWGARRQNLVAQTFAMFLYFCFRECMSSFFSFVLGFDPGVAIETEPGLSRFIRSGLWCLILYRRSQDLYCLGWWTRTLDDFGEWL